MANITNEMLNTLYTTGNTTNAIKFRLCMAGINPTDVINDNESVIGDVLEQNENLFFALIDDKSHKKICHVDIAEGQVCYRIIGMPIVHDYGNWRSLHRNYNLEWCIHMAKTYFTRWYNRQ